jgi:tetratricopeptide (TPR) repeat protein
LPPGVEHAILRALALEPGSRYSSAGAFVRRLREEAAGCMSERVLDARPADLQAGYTAQPAAGSPTRVLAPAPEQPTAPSVAVIQPEARRNPARQRVALAAERYQVLRWLPLVLVIIVALAGMTLLARNSAPLDRVAALLRDGDLALIAGRPADAYALYEQAATLDPADTASQQRLARILVLDERYEDAEQAAREALARHPGDARSLALLAEALAGRHQYDAALQAAEQARSLAPQQPGGDLARAMVLADRGLRRSSLALFAQAAASAERAAQVAARSDRSDPDAAIELARATAAQGYVALQRYQMTDEESDAAQASDWLARAVELQPRIAAFQALHGWLQVTHALALGRLGEPHAADAASAAAESFAAARRIDPTSATARAGQGWVAIASGQYDQAIERFDDVLADQATSDMAALGKAQALLQRSEPNTQAAIALLNQTLNTRPDTRIEVALGWALLAQAFEQDRDGLGIDGYVLAEQRFSQALASPEGDGSIEALNGLGWALRAHGLSAGDSTLYTGAEQVLRRSLNTRARQPDALFGLGWVAFARGQYSAAEQLFRQAAELAPADHTPRYWLGLALERQGYRDAARIALYEAQRLGSPFAREALARVGE